MNHPSTPLAPAAAAVENFADRAAAKADGAIASTHQATQHALESLHEGVDTLRQAAPALVNRTALQVEALTRRTLQRAHDASQLAKERVGRAGDRSIDYIRAEPVKSVLIAAATGAALLAVAGWWMRPTTVRR